MIKPTITSTKVVSGVNCHIEVFIDPLTAEGYCQLFVDGQPITKVLSGLDMLVAYFNTPDKNQVIAIKPSYNCVWRNWKPQANHTSPVEHLDYEDSDVVAVTLPSDFYCVPTSSAKKKGKP